MAIPPDLTAYESFLAEGDIGYDAPPGQLGLVDPGAGLKYDPRHHGWGSDVYAWHLGGGQGMPPSGIMTQVPGTTVQGTGGGGGGNMPIGIMPPLDSQFEQQVMLPIDEQFGNLEYQGTPGGDLGTGEFGLIDSSGKDFGPYTQADLATGQIGRQNVTGDITDYLDPIPLAQLANINPAAAVPAALTAGRIAKDAAGNWLYKGAAPGAKVAAQTAAKVTPWGQVGQAIKKEGGFGIKGKPGGFGSVNVGFDPKYTGKGATGLGGYITGGAKSVVGLPAAGNIAGGTPAQRLAFEKLAQSGAARGIGTLGRVAGLTTPVGAAITAATLTPTVIDALTKRDPDATETSMLGLDLQNLEDRAAAYDAGEAATLDDWGSPMGDVPDQTVTGITGPAGMEPTMADAGYRDPIMDMVAADQGVTADAGFSDADIQTAQSPESKSLLEKVASGVATAGDYVSKYGLAAWNFARGNMMGGALSLVGGAPLAFAGAKKTNVTPEDRAANAEFEQRNEINIGDDGRITSGPLQGLNPAGKSFAGSANYNEMVDKKIADIKNRKAPQTDASRLKIAELEAMKGPETRDRAIDEGILAAEDDKGSDMLDIPTEEEEDLTDLMGFETLGPWATDDTPMDEPTVTGIEGPPSIISPEPIEPTGPDPHGGFAAPITQEGGDASVAEAIAAENRAAEKAAVQESVSKQIGASRGNGGRDPSPPASKPDTSGWDSGGYDPAPAPSKSVGRQDPEGGGGGGGGGKIVCTMMNDSYGFGSFRNKIWLRQSKTLPMEYQLGYHALFLPLVKFSKREGLINKAVKKVLEHIAVHRTIDIRQEARGKTHMLGRVYRKILEPICYWVGKYGKRT